MKNVNDIHNYDESFIDQFIEQVIQIYDLWEIRPLHNDKKILVNGSAEDVESFSNFIYDHSEKNYPNPLLIIVGNSEKNAPELMASNSRMYYKLQFNKSGSGNIGSPLLLDEQRIPFQQSSLIHGQFGNLPGIGGLSGLNTETLKGIIDRNVADATRSIELKYQELNAQKEADFIRRMAELEAKIERSRLESEIREFQKFRDTWHSELTEREKQFQSDLEELETKRAEGIGTVKDYSKAIFGGLMELGKSYLGMDDSVKDVSGNDQKKKVRDHEQKNVFRRSRITEVNSDNLAEEEDDYNESFEQSNTEEFENEEYSETTIAGDSADGDEYDELNNLAEKFYNLPEEQKILLLELIFPTDSIEDDNDG